MPTELLSECPYWDCDQGTVTASGVCETCGRPSWECPECSAKCTLGSVFCRRCGAERKATSPWPQEGATAGRSFFAAPPQRGFDLSFSWSHPSELGRADGDRQLRPGPAPVLFSEHVLYYSSSGREFRAVPLVPPESKESPKLLWRSPVHRADMPLLSSPIIDGAFAYFLTASPRYLHRIELAGGSRAVCGMRVQRAGPGQADAGEHGEHGEQAYELPGECWDETPPVLFRIAPEGASAGPAAAQAFLAVLTHEGVCLVELPTSNRGAGSCLRVRFFPLDDFAARGRRWTRPVHAGNYLVSSSANTPDVLLVDLSEMPGSFNCQILPVPQMERFRRQSACTVASLSSNGDTAPFVCWYVADDGSQESRLLLLHPPGGFRSVEIGYVGTFAREGDSIYGPVSDGRSVYIPRWSAERNSLGITSYNGTRPVGIDLPAPELNPYFSCVARDELLIPSRTRLLFASPHTDAQEFRLGPPYHRLGNAVACVGKPIVGNKRVLVPLLDGISCYDMVPGRGHRA